MKKILINIGTVILYVLITITGAYSLGNLLAYLAISGEDLPAPKVVTTTATKTTETFANSPTPKNTLQVNRNTEVTKQGPHDSEIYKTYFKYDNLARETCNEYKYARNTYTSSISKYLYYTTQGDKNAADASMQNYDANTEAQKQTEIDNLEKDCNYYAREVSKYLKLYCVNINYNDVICADALNNNFSCVTKDGITNCRN